MEITVPKKNANLKFRNHYKKLPFPFEVYAGFECFTKPMNNFKPDLNKSFSMVYQKHDPCGFCFYNIKPLNNIEVEFEELKK